MKRLYLLSITILGLMWLVPQRADAQNNASIWNGTSEFWTQGSGTESNPYLIQNARQLACLAEFVNSGTPYNNTYFKLTTDVYIDSTIASRLTERTELADDVKNSAKAVDLSV